MIKIEEIVNTEAFKNISKTKTQTDYYIENNAHPDIVKLVVLGNKAFGEKIQRIIMEYLKLDKPNNSGHDILQVKSGIKFEVKSSRFWVNNGDWKWQHIMESHNYDYLLLCGINFMTIDVFVISKSDILKLQESKVITKQGGAEGQGLWCNYSKIKNYLQPIKNYSDLEKIILEKNV